MSDTKKVIAIDVTDDLRRLYYEDASSPALIEKRIYLEKLFFIEREPTLIVSELPTLTTTPR